jgi:O-antigen ligase
MGSEKRKNLGTWIRSMLALIWAPALIGVLLWLLSADFRAQREARAGLESGLAEDQPALSVPRAGTNVALEQYDADELSLTLGEISAVGFGTVRQHIPWHEIEPSPGEYRWEQWDRIIAAVHDAELDLIVVVDTSPAWARATGEAENIWAPPADPTDYAGFLHALAVRYGPRIRAYQIWDQPNIAPHWGSGEIDPARYVALLESANRVLRAVAPDAVIIGGGLAPNTEAGGLNMSDVTYLHEIYRRGAGDYFDVLGVHALGFWSGPEDRRVDEEVLNFSRAILLRQEMARRGDADKAVWAMDAGWCTLPADWAGRPATQGNDTPLVQAMRLTRAWDRLRQEWPWMGLVCMMQWQPAAAADDPIWGTALLDAQGQPTELLEPVSAMLVDDYNAVLFRPHLAPQAFLSPTYNLPVADFFFWGTDLDLWVQRDATSSGELAVLVDGEQQAVIDLAGEPGTERIRIAGGLSAGIHRVRLQDPTLRMAGLAGIQVGHRPSQARYWFGMYVGLLAVAQLAVLAWHAFRRLPWQNAWRRLRRTAERLARTGGPLCLVAGWALLLLPLPPAMRLLGLVPVGLASLFWPAPALGAATLALPWAPLTIPLGPGRFAVTEIAILLGVAGRIAGACLDRWSLPRAERPVLRLHVQLLDVAVLALAVLSIAAALLAEYRQVALRELRVVIAEAALFYALVRTAPVGRCGLLHLADALWITGLGVALYALLRYGSAGGVIEAEGVRRARGLYGSPNNLALVLERLLPLGVTLACWGRTRWRRWGAGLAALAMGAALALTFSRGAWFLGLPAMALAAALIRGGGLKRAALIALPLAATGALAALTLARSERLASLFDFTGGTSFLRLSLWQAAWDMARDHPWLGVGPDNFLYYYHDYIRPGAEVDRWLSHPHNIVLDFWLRLGIGGLAVLGALLAGFSRRAAQVYRRLAEGDLRAATLGLTLGVVGMAAHGLVDTSFFVIELACWFMFALGWVERLATLPAVFRPAVAAGRRPGA